MKKLLTLTLLFTIISTCFFSCTKEEDEVIVLPTTEKTLYFGEEYQIIATSNLPITYISEDKYHAHVSESGLVTAAFVGETNIILSNGKDTKNIKIIVKAKSNLYPVPNLEFGITRSALIAKLGNPASTTANAIGYTYISNAADLIMYTFDDNNKMNAIAVLVSTLYGKDLVTYLTERYYLIDADNFIFINALEYSKTTMIVWFDLYSINYWRVIYAPFDPSKNYIINKEKLLNGPVNELHQIENQLSK